MGDTLLPMDDSLPSNVNASGTVEGKAGRNWTQLPCDNPFLKVSGGTQEYFHVLKHGERP